MSDYSKFVFLNLEGYAVQVQDQWGAAFAVPPNKAVKGEWYARFAKPAYALSMVHESRVSQEAIMWDRVAEPKNERVAGSWAETRKRTDPFLILGPTEVAAATETTDPAPGTDETGDVTPPEDPEDPEAPVGDEQVAVRCEVDHHTVACFTGEEPCTALTDEDEQGDEDSTEDEEEDEGPSEPAVREDETKEGAQAPEAAARKNKPRRKKKKAKRTTV